MPIPDHYLQAPARERIVAFARAGKPPGNRFLDPICSRHAVNQPRPRTSRGASHFSRWRIQGARDKRGPMRTILLTILIAMLPISSVLAESTRLPKPAKHADQFVPRKGASGANSCAVYGPGFVKVEGTETCMKIGGAVGIGAGVSSGSR